jgi:predicted MFS family arabinose efflux permease
MTRLFRPRGPKHREEAAKLAASTINGVSIACLIGATFGPILNPALAWKTDALALAGAALALHFAAQYVLLIGNPRD